MYFFFILGGIFKGRLFCPNIVIQTSCEQELLKKRYTFLYIKVFLSKSFRNTKKISNKNKISINASKGVC